MRMGMAVDETGIVTPERQRFAAVGIETRSSAGFVAIELSPKWIAQGWRRGRGEPGAASCRVFIFQLAIDGVAQAPPRIRRTLHRLLSYHSLAMTPRAQYRKCIIQLAHKFGIGLRIDRSNDLRAF
jgi:hypothetical protein